MKNISTQLKIAFFLVIWGAYLLAGVWWAHHQRPSGDEPHYLIIASSLIHDHDLDLTNNYLQKDYQAWGYPTETLDTHTSVNSQGGKAYSVHNIGWPLVFSPFFAIAGRAGVTFLTSLIAAALVFNLYLLLLRFTKNQFISVAVSVIIGFSAPVLIYSTQIFNEIFGALLTLYVYRKIIEKSEKPLDLIIVSLAIAYLPWIHIKYLLLSLVLFVSWIITNLKKKLLPAGFIYFASLMILGYFFLHWYGSISPNAQYPATFGFDLPKIGQGILGLFLDRTFGILPLTPVYFLSIAGFYFLYKKNKSVFWQTLVIFLGLFLVQATGAIYIGWAPAGRFLVIVLPLLAIPIAACFMNLVRWSKILFWHLTGWGFLVGYILILHPDLNYSLAKPVFLNAISPSFTNFGKYFPQLITVEHYPATDTKTVFITIFWLVIILTLNLTIIWRAKRVLENND